MGLTNKADVLSNYCFDYRRVCLQKEAIQAVVKSLKREGMTDSFDKHTTCIHTYCSGARLAFS